MTTEIENAIKLLAEKIKVDVNANDALKITQATLNLAHALTVVKGTS